ncbi:cysteine-rich receptor-like protein kinase 15 isoform X2 [Amaranthus tricolor]|uniref:cysteine-rich receptor-like protein kinase 15 isoform X2 n=1 Tax=Amaranthus tricolor TaxID=29722 RepID=UPI002590F24C|nr:cysteine-rich receptor-like protein kinase 15 isoform X2 [Amaranthus tricolor]
MVSLPKLLIVLSLATFIFITQLIASDPQYVFIKPWCSSTDFDLESSYRTNLNKLLSTLPTLAGESTNQGYYTTSISVTPDSTKIYGQFLCRGDTTPQDCNGCVSTAVINLPPKECPQDMSAVIWYDKCMVRYSNESFLSFVNDTIAEGWKNHEDISSYTSEINRFKKLAGDTMNTLASNLSSLRPNNNSGLEGDRKYYITKDVEFNSYVRLYTMAQCTPDLTPTVCGMCQNILINRMDTYCDGSRGCHMLNPSCDARYEVYRFYEDITPTPTRPPLPLPSPPSSSPKQGAQVQGKGKPNQTLVVNISLACLVLFLAILVTVLVFLLCKKRPVITRMHSGRNHALNFGNESLQFEFTTLQYATNNFSDFLKIGEGGFGVVYKGTLPNGQHIAVKRLSKDTPQGAEQFKNEVVFVAKLQHKNLVRLLGFCLTPDEKLLVYEFVTNKSLDLFLFEKGTQGTLDWSARYKIIQGVARGMFYLHEDSRLKIIHRDLKASNILLDTDMNPKISDFGLAKNFAVNQKQDQTSRLAGTLGYMAPEYVEYGEISTKSDVYSFGVLVIEIITGKKITHRQSLVAENLLTYVWRHWCEGTPLEVIDTSLGTSYSDIEVLQCLHIGLLCVQGDTEGRPTMLSIVSYLNGSLDLHLPTPQQPAYAVGNRTRLSSSGSKTESSSRSTGQQSDKSVIRSSNSFSGIEASSH